jgi:hypothetical protein
MASIGRRSLAIAADVADRIEPASVLRRRRRALGGPTISPRIEWSNGTVGSTKTWESIEARDPSRSSIQTGSDEFEDGSVPVTSAD